MIPFEWVQPIGGKKIVWKPLTIGQELDIIASHSREDRKHLAAPMLLCARVVKYGEAEKLTYADLYQWDTYDYTSFVDDIERVEAERREACRKSRPDNGTVSPIGQLENYILEVQEAARRLSGGLRELLDWAKAMEAQHSSPLESARP